MGCMTRACTLEPPDGENGVVQSIGPVAERDLNETLSVLALDKH